MQLDQTNPGVHQALLQRWQKTVDQADHFIVALSTGPAEARMARLLITLGSNGDHPEAMLSREDMGALLGITTETASRIMAEFKRRGLVSVDKGSDVVCDYFALTQLANG
jgi:CRP-like cAMP-binding protein